MKTFLNILLVIWQLPQIILGAIIYFIASVLFKVKRKKIDIVGEHIDELKFGINFINLKANEILNPKSINFIYIKSPIGFGVSLSKYFILLSKEYERFLDLTVKHEYGHAIQSVYLGPLYLIIIGLPSVLGNLYDRIFHKNWKSVDRIKWYYNQPVEKWADKLGRVDRTEQINVYTYGEIVNK